MGQHPKHGLAQIEGISGLDELTMSDLCTQTVMRRNMNAKLRISTKFAFEILQVVDS